jgi:hypothetical protein
MLKRINEFFQDIDKSHREALEELCHTDPQETAEALKKDQIEEIIRLDKELGDASIFFF